MPTAATITAYALLLGALGTILVAILSLRSHMQTMQIQIDGNLKAMLEEVRGRAQAEGHAEGMAQERATGLETAATLVESQKRS